MDWNGFHELDPPEELCVGAERGRWAWILDAGFENGEIVEVGEGGGGED